MRELGWLVVTKVPAVKKAARRGQRGGKRVDKEGQLEIKDIVMPDDSVIRVPIHHKDGQAGVVRLDESGEPVFVPLERIRTQRFPGRKGFR